MSAADNIDDLRAEMPELFKDPALPVGWSDDFIVVEIDEPTKFPVVENPNIDNRQTDQTDDDPESFPEPLIWGEDDFVPNGNLYPEEVFGGKHPGSLITKPPPGKYPPPDCLAFYWPFHYYHPNWWGIYLRVEGVDQFASNIRRLSKAPLTWVEARKLARLFLYYHEAFHHSTECFATRLEVSHRLALYQNGFEQLYQKTVFSPSCLEESLAQANALLKVEKVIKKDYRSEKIMKALCEIVRLSPPGYCEGKDIHLNNDFERTRNCFSEENMKVCFPSTPTKKHGIWGAANHMYTPISNIKSRVNYIIPRGSPVSGRWPFRPYMSSRDIKKKLSKLVGLRLVRHGKHPIYENKRGNTIAIPEHPRDLHKGIIKKIIRDAGLDMTLSEFQRA
jgi:predicted RNA binding protein YcfA (HicA-like mRNA interferase family)